MQWKWSVLPKLFLAALALVLVVDESGAQLLRGRLLGRRNQDNYSDSTAVQVVQPGTTAPVASATTTTQAPVVTTSSPVYYQPASNGYRGRLFGRRNWSNG